MEIMKYTVFFISGEGLDLHSMQGPEDIIFDMGILPFQLLDQSLDFPALGGDFFIIFSQAFGKLACTLDE